MSASPQVENGFVMIALDLFVALMTSDLPNGDMIVLTWVLLQSYGPNKRRDVFLDPVTLEERTGLHRNNVRASIRSLVAGGLLQKTPSGAYRFSKNWEAYAPKGKPFRERLEGALKRFAMSTLEDPQFIKKSKRTPIQPDFSTIQLDSATNCLSNPTGLPDKPSEQSNWIGTSAYAKPSEGDLTADVITTSESSLTRAPARAADISAENAIPQHSAMREASKSKGNREPISPGHAEAVAEATKLFGDLFADDVLICGKNISDQLGGRFEFFTAALKKTHAKMQKESVRNPFRYAMETATGMCGSGKIPRAYRPEQESSSSRLPVIRAEHDARRPPIRSKNAIQPTPAKEGA